MTGESVSFMTQSVKRKKVQMSKQEFTGWILELLFQRRHREAAAQIWPWMIQNEWTELIWDRMEKHKFLCIMGHGSASKTFTAASYNLLDWWSNPTETATIITSDTLTSMERRVWADVKNLYTKATERVGVMPGILLDKILRSTQTDEKNAIHAIAAESNDSQSKIQGIHTKKIRVLFDEADNKFSNSIWSALANLGTSGDLRAVALANPFNRESEFGKKCEPKDGWDSVNPETDFEWEGCSGWHILRLDGLRSPNFTTKTFFPFLLSQAGLDNIRTQYGGENSREWWGYVRGWFPPEGTVNTIFPLPLIKTATDTNIAWLAGTRKLAAGDPAFDGGDSFRVAIGRTGRLADKPERPGVSAEKFVTIGRKDKAKDVSIDFGDQFIELCKREGVAPEDAALDSSGAGLPFADYVRSKWSKGVMKVCFGGGASTMKATAEDSTPANERYDRFVSELWFTAREWIRLGMAVAPNAPRELRDDLSARLYEPFTRGKIKNGIKIESKTEMKGRNLKSPDTGDAFCLLVHLARVRADKYTPGTIKDASTKSQFGRFVKQASVHEADYGVRG